MKWIFRTEHNGEPIEIELSSIMEGEAELLFDLAVKSPKSFGPLIAERNRAILEAVTEEQETIIELGCPHCLAADSMQCEKCLMNKVYLDHHKDVTCFESANCLRIPMGGITAIDIESILTHGPRNVEVEAYGESDDVVKFAISHTYAHIEWAEKMIGPYGTGNLQASTQGDDDPTDTVVGDT